MIASAMQSRSLATTSRKLTSLVPVQRVKRAADHKQIVQADMEIVMNASGKDKNHNLAPGVAAALYAAAKYSSLDVTVDLLRTVIAATILFMAVSSTFLKGADDGGVVTGVMAPAALAMETLSILPMLSGSVLAAGVAVCRRAGNLFGETGVYYGAVATMAASVYFHHATIWFCCAYALVQGGEVTKAVQNDKVPVLPLVPLAVATYAVFDYFVNGVDHTKLITICLILGELVWAVGSTVRSVMKSE